MKYLACIVGGCVQWSKLTTKIQEHAVNQDRQSSKSDLRTHCSQRGGDFVLFLFDGISVFIMPERQLCEICHFLQAHSIEKHTNLRWKNEKVIVKCNFKRYSIFSRPLLAAVPGSHTLPAAVRQKTCLVPFPPLALALPRVGPAWPSTLSQRIHSEPQRGTRNPTGNPLLSKTPNPYHPLVNIGHAW